MGVPRNPEPVPEWAAKLDDFKFAEGPTDVRPSAHTARKAILCAPADFVYTGYCRLVEHFSWGVPGRLDRSRLLVAAKQMLESFPALGSRLDLTSAPSLRLDDARFPISFAQWPSGSASDVFEPSQGNPYPTAPIYDQLEVQQAILGKGPLFRLRVTSLGDDSTVIAASWLHMLMDGKAVTNCIKWMSTAYRDGSRAELPEPFLERNTWPHQLVQYLPEEQRAEIKAQGLAQMSVAHELLSTEEITSTEQILGSGALPGAEENGAEIVYVGIDQETVNHLVAVIAPLLKPHGVPYIASGDIVAGLSWMLLNDTLGYERPFQGPQGSVRMGAVALDLGGNGLPEELTPAGFAANLIAACPLYAQSDGSMHSSPDEPGALYKCLASLAGLVRMRILGSRTAEATLDALVQLGRIVPAEANKAFEATVGMNDLDVYISNWTKLGHDQVDFGTGAATFWGHPALLGSSFNILPWAGNKGFVLSVPVTPGGLQRLANSPVLKTLVPKADVSQIGKALQQHK